MKKLLLSSLVGVLPPVAAFAQQWDVPLSNDGFAYASIFAGSFSLLLSIVIGIIATTLVFRAAKKLGGGLFGLVLNYVGIGMSLIVLGTVSAVADSWLIGSWFDIISMACFAMGYVFLVVGANKLLKGIMNT
ncbi:MAG: hypothetical protein AAB837_02260 [Patescibacteria group bacterium]